MNIQMVDLKGQYNKIKPQVDRAIADVIESCAFINGPQVGSFATHLKEYLGVKHVITCANGTDALQISLMALGLERGDEVIVPAFTYVATAEVIGLLGLVPVMVDVDYDTFNVALENIEKALTPRTRAIVPVHLFGQSCNMAQIMEFAQAHNLYVIEDNAQALGAYSLLSEDDGNGGKVVTRKRTGTSGHIGCTSFFPSKNLGCYGDGGAIMTNDDLLAQKLRMIANHGQKIKYHHSVIGCNSRLDTIQAAVLDVKLAHLDEYCAARYRAASYYTEKLSNFDPDRSFYHTPVEAEYATHVYHQYTLKIVAQGRRYRDENGEVVSARDALKSYLAKNGIPSMIYYPLPLQEQEAFRDIAIAGERLETARKLSGSVLSLPMHTELTEQVQDFIIEKIKEFFLTQGENV
ncbi:MAG: DegT/DnrJ/EryC1/StrS family aminotransferase [Bacteroidales bacterium]|nr:DegT/DnrJ/EryC1/StrS family aminotransferase [Bacteroidales bacterium]